MQYLARVTGHRCLRINNHEHTDLQEYVGCYSANLQGQLEFKEGQPTGMKGVGCLQLLFGQKGYALDVCVLGVLVEAMRKGHWILLDELNLAPTDVLEALNRVRKRGVVLLSR